MLQNNLNILCITKLDLVRDFMYVKVNGVKHLSGEGCCGGNCNC